MAAELFDFHNPNLTPQPDRDLNLLSSLNSPPARSSSDWEVLNRTTSALIRHRLAAAGQSPATIQLAQSLIASYHKVYRADLMQRRHQGDYGPCLAPTAEQLDRIRQHWQENGSDYSSQNASEAETDQIQDILRELQRLANLLRQEFNSEF